MRVIVQLPRARTAVFRSACANITPKVPIAESASRSTTTNLGEEEPGTTPTLAKVGQQLGSMNFGGGGLHFWEVGSFGKFGHFRRLALFGTFWRFKLSGDWISYFCEFSNDGTVMKLILVGSWNYREVGTIGKHF